MAQPPTFDDAFFRLIIKYEYLKKSSIKAAARKYNKMMMSNRLTDEMRQNLAEFDEDQTFLYDVVKTECDIQRSALYWVIENLYETFDQDEYDAIVEKQPMKMESVMELASRQKIRDLHSCDDFRLPINQMKISAGYGKNVLEIWGRDSSDYAKMEYWIDDEKGVIFWKGDRAMYTDGDDYIDHATDDFQFLFNSSGRFESLELYTEPWTKWNPKRPPNLEFFEEIDFLKKKEVRKLSVTLPLKDFAIAHMIWVHLKPGVLETIKIRVWDDSEYNLWKNTSTFPDKLSFTQQWKHAKELDIQYKTIQKHWIPFCHFETYRIDCLAPKDISDIRQMFAHLAAGKERTIHVTESLEFCEIPEKRFGMEKKNVRMLWLSHHKIVAIIEENAADKEEIIEDLSDNDVFSHKLARCFADL